MSETEWQQIEQMIILLLLELLYYHYHYTVMQVNANNTWIFTLNNNACLQWNICSKVVTLTLLQWKDRKVMSKYKCWTLKSCRQV